jgi:hypothetical protein
LSGPASGLVITSTPAGRFVYWLDRKPADLISGDSRYVAYIDSLLLQEGTPLARADSNTPTEVVVSKSSLGTPDRQVFMAAGDTPGPSGTAQDKYLEDTSSDELSADAPANETPADRDARRERNRKRNERRQCLRDNFPVRNLAEALEAVKSRVHTTPEQCLVSIRAIALQAQGIRAGEVIAKLAEDAYFMRVDNRVNQPPPTRPRDNEATSRSANNDPNRTRAELLAEPNRPRSNAGGPPQRDNSNREVVPHRAPAGGGGHDPDGGGSDGGSSNHGANRRAGGSGGRGHANSHASGASQGGYDARQKIEELRRKKSTTTGDGDGFPAFSPRLRNLLLPDKFKPLGITKYDAKQDSIQWLRCYALSTENAGGNNDTKCLYFPFCLDQAPLTWLESLDKHSIDKWDQLKE